jgi:hypothetical protein
MSGVITSSRLFIPKASTGKELSKAKYPLSEIRIATIKNMGHAKSDK